jgi:hypothetical protein
MNPTPSEELNHLAFHVDKFLSETKKLGHDKTLEVKSKNSKWGYIKDPKGIFIELCA